MSRSNKGGKGPGYEYWKSRCPKVDLYPGRAAKKYTHKVERQKNKEAVNEEQSHIDSDIDNWLDDERWDDDMPW